MFFIYLGNGSGADDSSVFVATGELKSKRHAEISHLADGHSAYINKDQLIIGTKDDECWVHKTLHRTTEYWATWTPLKLGVNSFRHETRFTPFAEYSKIDTTSSECKWAKAEICVIVMNVS